MIDAEIVFRRIELPLDKYDRRKVCSQLNIKGKWDFLRVSQMKVLTGEFKARDGIRRATCDQNEWETVGFGHISGHRPYQDTPVLVARSQGPK